ncbi:3'(2'),5'-bisphosphate nucleotidase CysQ [Millionella massiliensis]|uniref:3'(2'),5'-bisphosphate nucleotidase CysQ n=2 Tax=Millionella massiliensis TaxID=1871023 RepID=UPI0024B775F5|nr:3'(2'),5'-bisphosphate nucleotidase CysQ [Millionella massiliensis]
MIEREQTDFFLVEAYNAAVRAGAKIMEIYTRYDDFFVSLKADSTPITIADKEAHTLIKNHLSVTRIPLLSEEGRDLYYDERRGWDLFWMVDPLDGTEEFIKRNGEFTVNIALMVDNAPFLGVIYIPTTETIYFSDPDRGSFCKTGIKPDINSACTISQIFADARRLPVVAERNTPLKVALSRSHESNQVRDLIRQLQDQVGEVRIVEYGSSLKMCLVAEGAVDCYLRTTPTSEWDTAAGEAIARGAGVRVVALSGEPLRYNEESLENPPFICLTRHLSGYEWQQ